MPVHSELSKLRREMDALRAQLQAATDEPCAVVRIRRAAESGEIVTVESGNTAGPGHTCADRCKALVIGLAEDPEASDFREELAKRAAREVQRVADGAELPASLEQTRRTCAFYGVPFPEAVERPPADVSSDSDASGEGAGARSDRGRGDAQPSPGRASAESTHKPTVEAAHSPAPAYGPNEGVGEVVIGGRARDAVVEMGPARVSVPLGAPTPQLGPEDAVGGPEPHGRCATPWCGHPLEEHHCYSRTLPCRYCNWPVMAHDGVAVALEPLPYAARRLWACSTYLAINFEGGEQDGCTVAGCGCPGWRRRPPWITERQEALMAQLAERDRTIARNAAELERLRAECEARQRELLRAKGPNDLGASPHGAPVFVGGDT